MKVILTELWSSVLPFTTSIRSFYERVAKRSVPKQPEREAPRRWVAGRKRETGHERQLLLQ